MMTIVQKTVIFRNLGFTDAPKNSFQENIDFSHIHTTETCARIMLMHVFINQGLDCETYESRSRAYSAVVSRLDGIKSRIPLHVGRQNTHITKTCTVTKITFVLVLRTHIARY